MSPAFILGAGLIIALFAVYALGRVLGWWGPGDEGADYQWPEWDDEAIERLKAAIREDRARNEAGSSLAGWLIPLGLFVVIAYWPVVGR